MARGTSIKQETEVVISSRQESHQQRIDFLVAEIKRHKELYYNGAAEITDAEYDALERELAQLDDGSKSEVLKEVGAKPSGLFEEVEHDKPMLSLDKVYSEEDLKKFLDKHPGEDMSVMPKFDGVSLSLLYERGNLIRAATRGDGKIGEVITENAKRIKGVRQQLDEAVDCEIRGEVLMKKSDWQQYNRNNPDKQFANPRNAVSGSMRLKDSQQVAKRPMIFVAYDIIIDSNALNEQNIEAQLGKLGFSMERYSLARDQDKVWDYIQQTELDRQGLDYEIDGVVIRVANQEAYEAAGFTSHHPRAAMAYKFAAEIGQATLEKVTWQVGKSGIVAPVAEISPLFLAGTNIRRASLHNLEVIADRGVKIGDRIEIKRAGDVIPHVVGVSGDNDNSQGIEIKAPDACPSCQKPLEIDSSGVVRCLNITACPEQSHRRLIHWGSRAGADIDALGESWLEKFADAGLVNKTSDLYKLSREDFFDADDEAKFEGMGERLSKKILASIEGSKQLGLRKALIGLSIPYASDGTAKRICRAGYESIEQVSEATPEQLAEIEDIGPVVAQSIRDFLNRAEVQDEIKELRRLGVNMNVFDDDRPIKKQTDNPLAGKTVVITGALDGISRKELQAKIESLGGKASNSVSAKTDILVAGEKAGSKKDKAEQLGIDILDQAGIEALLR